MWRTLQPCRLAAVQQELQRIPLFVIINGVANFPSHDQEVLYNSAGYQRSLNIINTVKAAQTSHIDSRNHSRSTSANSDIHGQPGEQVQFQFQWQFTKSRRSKLVLDVR